MAGTPEYRQPHEYATDPRTGKAKVIRYNPTAFYVAAGVPMMAFQVGPSGAHFFTAPPGATYVPLDQVPPAIRKAAEANPPTPETGAKDAAYAVVCRYCEQKQRAMEAAGGAGPLDHQPIVMSTDYPAHLEAHLSELQGGPPVVTPPVLTAAPGAPTPGPKPTKAPRPPGGYATGKPRTAAMDKFLADQEAEGGSSNDQSA